LLGRYGSSVLSAVTVGWEGLASIRRRNRRLVDTEPLNGPRAAASDQDFGPFTTTSANRTP